MNVHHLELYYFVAKYEGITAAVRKMPYGIQQPAVSGQILQLEESLGVKLFNRRPFSLTPAGEELYDFIYPFFSKLNQVEEQLKGEESKHLRVAASAAVIRNHVPDVLATLHNRESNLKLTLKEIEPSDIHSAITSQQVDIAVSVIHGNLTDGVTSQALLSLDIVLYVPEEWEVDTLEDLIEENDEGKGYMIDKPLIGLPANEAITKIFDKSLEKMDVYWPVTLEVNSVDIVRQYVKLGFGAGIGVAIPKTPPFPGIKTIPIKDFPPVVVGAVYQGKLKPIAQLFLDTVKAKAAELS